MHPIEIKCHHHHHQIQDLFSRPCRIKFSLRQALFFLRFSGERGQARGERGVRLTRDAPPVTRSALGRPTDFYLHSRKDYLKTYLFKISYLDIVLPFENRTEFAYPVNRLPSEL